MPERRRKSWVVKGIGLILIPVILSAVGSRLDRVSNESTGLGFFAQVFAAGLQPAIWEHLLFTLKHFLIGYAVSMALGAGIGVAMARFVTVENLIRPAVMFLRPLPSAAIIPLAMLIFPYVGTPMKVFVISYGALWPILLQVYQGSKSLDHHLVDTGRTLGKTRAAIFFGVELPAAVPDMLAGGRVAIGISLLLAVTVEMLILTEPMGIGYLILDSERAFLHDKMLAAVIVVGIAGWILDRAFRFLETKVMPWNPRVQNAD